MTNNFINKLFSDSDFQKAITPFIEEALTKGYSEYGDLEFYSENSNEVLVVDSLYSENTRIFSDGEEFKVKAEDEDTEHTNAETKPILYLVTVNDKKKDAVYHSIDHIHEIYEDVVEESEDFGYKVGIQDLDKKRVDAFVDSLRKKGYTIKDFSSNKSMTERTQTTRTQEETDKLVREYLNSPTTKTPKNPVEDEIAPMDTYAERPANEVSNIRFTEAEDLESYLNKVLQENRGSLSSKVVKIDKNHKFYQYKFDYEIIGLNNKSGETLKSLLENSGKNIFVHKIYGPDRNLTSLLIKPKEGKTFTEDEDMEHAETENESTYAKKKTPYQKRKEFTEGIDDMETTQSEEGDIERLKGYQWSYDEIYNSYIAKVSIQEAKMLDLIPTRHKIANISFTYYPAKEELYLHAPDAEKYLGLTKLQKSRPYSDTERLQSESYSKKLYYTKDIFKAATLLLGYLKSGESLHTSKTLIVELETLIEKIEERDQADYEAQLNYRPYSETYKEEDLGVVGNIIYTKDKKHSFKILKANYGEEGLTARFNIEDLNTKEIYDVTTQNTGGPKKTRLVIYWRKDQPKDITSYETEYTLDPSFSKPYSETEKTESKVKEDLGKVGDTIITQDKSHTFMIKESKPQDSTKPGNVAFVKVEDPRDKKLYDAVVQESKMFGLMIIWKGSTKPKDFEEITNIGYSIDKTKKNTEVVENKEVTKTEEVKTQVEDTKKQTETPKIDVESDVHLDVTKFCDEKEVLKSEITKFSERVFSMTDRNFSETAKKSKADLVKNINELKDKRKKLRDEKKDDEAKKITPEIQKIVTELESLLKEETKLLDDKKETTKKEESKKDDSNKETPKKEESKKENAIAPPAPTTKTEEKTKVEEKDKIDLKNTPEEVTKTSSKTFSDSPKGDSEIVRILNLIRK